MDYYGDTMPWSLNGERIAVVQNNEHLGLVVSGLHEEQKNVDSAETQSLGCLDQYLPTPASCLLQLNYTFGEYIAYLSSHLACHLCQLDPQY